MFDLSEVRREHYSFILKLQRQNGAHVYYVYGGYIISGCDGFLGPFHSLKTANGAWRQYRIGTHELPVFQIGEQVENVERKSEGSESMSRIAEAGASVVS